MNLLPAPLKRWISAKLGLTRRTIFDPRTQVQNIAPTVDVDRVHSIMAEADAGNPRDLFALYQEILLSDSHLQAEFNKRLLAVLGDVVVINPADAKSDGDKAAADFIRANVEGCTTFLDGCRHLLSSALWPVALVEKIFSPIEGGGYRLAKLIPVPDQLLDFTLGRLRIRATNELGQPTGQYYEPSPDRYITHRGHLMSAPDTRGGPMRSLVWWWLLSTMDREWWGRFLDRFGMPFAVGKFDQADDASQNVLVRAFSYMTRLGGLVVSKDTQVELVQAATAQTGEAFERFLAVIQREKSKLIVGQTLSSEARQGGLNGGDGGQQEEVRQDIRQFDAMMLGACLRTQLFAQLVSVNRLAGAVPSITWGGESPLAAEAIAKIIASLAGANLTPTDDALATLGERIGFSLQRSAQPAPQLPEGGLISTNSASVRRLRSTAELADEANDLIARAGSADLAQAFSGDLAPVARLIRNSSSIADLEAGLQTLFPRLSHAKAATLLENASVAFAANRAVVG